MITEDFLIRLNDAKKAGQRSADDIEYTIHRCTDLIDAVQDACDYMPEEQQTKLLRVVSELLEGLASVGISSNEYARKIYNMIMLVMQRKQLS